MHRNHRSLIKVLAGLAATGLVLIACDVGNSITTAKTTLTDRFNSSSIPSHHVVPVTVSCKPGEQMVSGGWAVTTPGYSQPVSVGSPGPNQDQLYDVTGSFPSGPSSWTIIFTNEAIGDALGTAHIECLSTGVTPTIVTLTATDPNSAIVQTPACPQGSTVTGGGFELTNLTNTSQIVDFETSEATNLSSWLIATDYELASIMAGGQGVEAFAVCATNLTTLLGTPTTVTALHSSSSNPLIPTMGTTGAYCATGTVPVGSGYREEHNMGAFPLTLFYPDYGGTPPQWDATGFSMPFIPIDSPNYVAGGSATIIPICAKLP